MNITFLYTMMLSEPTPSSALVLSYLFLNIFMNVYLSLTKLHWLPSSKEMMKISSVHLFYAAGELESPLLKNALDFVPGFKWVTDKLEPQTACI